MECPKCQAEHADGDTECQKCGIIFAKYRLRQAREDQPPDEPVFVEQQQTLLNKCKACGRDVSKNAKACQHCGESAPEKKTPGCFSISLAIIGMLMLFSYLGGGRNGTVGSTAAVTPAKTSAEIRMDEVQKCFSGWDGSHRELTRTIKAGMKNPDSYKHVETRYVDNDNHLLVFTTYRGTNSYGAVMTSTITAETLLDCQVNRVISQ